MGSQRGNTVLYCLNQLESMFFGTCIRSHPLSLRQDNAIT